MSSSEKKYTIAVFDFDETLIKKDTLIDFIYSSFSLPVFTYKALLCLPMLIRFKLKTISNDQAKEELLTRFFENMDKSSFELLCSNYKQRLDKIVNPDAIKRLKWHQNKGDKTVIVSASIVDWIKPWANEHGINNVIATKIASTDNKITGKLATPNCHGPEKVKRFLKEYPKRGTYELYVYGDGKSDQDMFKIGDKIFEKKFL